MRSRKLKGNKAVAGSRLDGARATRMSSRPQACLPTPTPSSSCLPACPPRGAPQVEFGAAKTICDVRVDSVLDARSGQHVKYGSRTALVTEGYHVE